MTVNTTMIEGVKIKNLTVHQDIADAVQLAGEQPGFLMEVLRQDENLLQEFGQSTFTVAYPGAIKAFHWHKNQADLWFVASGRAKIVLYDLRPNSATQGQTQVIYAGSDKYKLVLIPVGVAHGYKVIGQEPVLLFYHTTKSYNPKNPDEERIAFDDSKISFDWQAD